MKTTLHHLAAALAALVAFPPVLCAADEKPAPKPKSELRVVSSPERRIVIERGGDKGEKETVAFLGVETGPVSATTGAQLGLARGTGLVVNHVVPKGPAEGVLQQHDILLKLDDQILIESRQLAVLVRNKKQGDEVSLTYLRAGQKATAKVTLGQHEVPKLSAVLDMGADGLGFAAERAGPAARVFELPLSAAGRSREETDQVLALIDQARAQHGSSGQHGPVRIQIDRQGGPGFRAMSINTADSNLVFSDDAGTLQLSHKDGAKTLVAKDAKGVELFSGPVTTPEERKALPDAVRARLEKLEGMRNMSFRTDADFRGAETKVVRPLERSISLPRTMAPGIARAPGVL